MDDLGHYLKTKFAFCSCRLPALAVWKQVSNLLTFNQTWCLILTVIQTKGVIDMDDKKKIAELGGVSALARRLKVTPQRVQNWTRRGIPAKVKLDNYELFNIANKSK